MLHAYSVQISFGRAVTIFRTRERISVSKMLRLLQLRPFDERDWYRLMGPAQGSPVMAMLDLEFQANQEFGVASEESEVMSRAHQFADKLYEFTPENYDDEVKKVMGA